MNCERRSELHRDAAKRFVTRQIGDLVDALAGRIRSRAGQVQLPVELHQPAAGQADDAKATLGIGVIVVLEPRQAAERELRKVLQFRMVGPRQVKELPEDGLFGVGIAHLTFDPNAAVQFQVELHRFERLAGWHVKVAEEVRLIVGRDREHFVSLAARHAVESVAALGVREGADQIVLTEVGAGKLIADDLHARERLAAVGVAHDAFDG